MEDKIFKYGNDIVWSLPLMFEFEYVWGAIVKSFKFFDIDIPQVNGFGCPRTNWYGGRFPIVIQEIGPTMLSKTFEYCKNIGITPSFTFTKSKITATTPATPTVIARICKSVKLVVSFVIVAPQRVQV